MAQQKFRQPHWWTDVHNTAWDHVREAFRNEWEERRAAEPPEQKLDWDEAEPAIRFGFGSRRRLAQKVETPESDVRSQAREERTAEAQSDWDPETEATLEQEWDSMHNVSEEAAAPRLWHDVRQFVHRGWFGP